MNTSSTPGAFKARTGRLLCLAAALATVSFAAQAAAPPSPQGFILGNAYTDITGTAVANLTGSPKFPDSPDQRLFFPYFEWNADGDINVVPGNWGDNFGGQIVGYFYPPDTGAYYFAIAADDNAELYLSTDADPANKKLIARETAYSDPRVYDRTAEVEPNSVAEDKLSDLFTGTEWPTLDPYFGGALIELVAGQPYYIEALFKEGGGGDNLSVSVEGGAGLAIGLPIPGQYLATDRSGPTSILQDPASQSIDERGSVTFKVDADGLPPYAYQWLRDGTAIQDATNFTYTIPSVAVADNDAAFSVTVTGGTGAGSATSAAAVLTVIPDTTQPTLLSASPSPNGFDVTLAFSEPLDAASAETTANYQVSSAGGAVGVSAAVLSGNGTQVMLSLASQTAIGVKYTVLVSNVQDTAATPNTIADNSKVIFVPVGELQEINGFIVFEVENYDDILGDLWMRGTTVGNASGGAYMALPDNVGDSEANDQLLYNVPFAQTATYQVWYHASVGDVADGGAADSAWFHLDGARPVEREAGNSASMTGFNGQTIFAWRSDAQDPPDPFTVDVTAGMHVVGIAAREDGAHFDKMILTTDTSFTPTGLGPSETRDGTPNPPTVSVTSPTDGEVFGVGSDITLTADAAGDPAVGIDIARVEFTANNEVVGEAVESPFSVVWANVQDGIYSIQATTTDELGVSSVSDPILIEVGEPPPQVLLVVGTDSDPVLNASDAGVQARLEGKGWQVTVMQAPTTTTADGAGKDLILVSATVASGDVGTKFRDLAVPVVNWEQAVQDDFLLTLNAAEDHNNAADQTEANIINADHPLAGGLSAGLTTFTTGIQPFGWGVPGPGAVIIATVATNASQAVIYGYDTGSTLIDGTTPAPAPRVMFFWGNDGFANSTEDALTLFDAAVVWASGIDPSVKTSATIAWVSFHPADDTPSAAAASAGFTMAPDVDYTALLTAQGHQVTRVITSGTPDAALLNAFDLVIISRSVPSGDYQDAPEAAAWNGITAPTMVLGGYILRNSRLGYTTGGTMVDTTNSIALTVNDPSHPIFEGIELDAGNTMVNPYADVMMFNGTVQRGVSVNTDPAIAGGTVLATVGTAADPTVGGMVIGEYQAGTTMGNGGADILAGHRLAFLTGSREASGLTSEGSGIYDLTDDGAALFLNAVNYMAGTVPGVVRPALSYEVTAGGMDISFTGTLEMLDTIGGTWAPVDGATSPHPVTTSAAAQQFYRSVLE